MKKSKVIIVILISALLMSCSGSETYRGSWKATDVKGEKFEIVFQEKKISIIETNGDSSIFDYSQNNVLIENGVETYGIQLGDGKNLKVNFPLSNDETKGLILDANSQPIYFIGRNKYVVYQDIFGI